jgi:hypothetical protein
VPFEPLEGASVRTRVARSLPGSVARRHLLIPFHVENGRLHVAGPEFPSDDTLRQLRGYTRLKIEFHYVTPSNFDRLSRELLGSGLPN